MVDKVASASIYPSSTKMLAGVSYYNYSIAPPFIHLQSNSQDFYFGGAFYYTSLSSGTYIERTYERGTIDGTGRTFAWKDNAKNVVLSFVYKGNLDIAFGVTVKYISESLADYTVNGFGFDVGGLIRQPIINYENKSEILYFAPAFGFSVRNFGPDMTFINNSFPLPKSSVYGFSTEIGKRQYFSDTHTADLFSFQPSLDIEKKIGDSWLYKLGIDVSLYELFNVRVGKIIENGTYDDKTTFGFTLSTFNLGKFILLSSGGNSSQRGGLTKFLYENCNVEYNFAQYDNNYFENQEYHEIIVTYQL